MRWQYRNPNSVTKRKKTFLYSHLLDTVFTIQIYNIVTQLYVYKDIAGQTEKLASLFVIIRCFGRKTKVQTYGWKIVSVCKFSNNFLNVSEISEIFTT